VVEAPHRCAVCGSRLPPEARTCPVCDSPVRPLSAPTPAPAVPSAPLAGNEIDRRIARLAQWDEEARMLGVKLPVLPAWAEPFAHADEDRGGWAQVLRGIERVAQRRVVEALESWEEKTRARLVRLEAYSVDSRLEREEIDEVLHAARIGEIQRAVTGYVRVDRVVALKERHLDRAREELEKLVEMFRDMPPLGLVPPQPADELSATLEQELRRGQLAALHSKLRELRAAAAVQLRLELPGLITRLGDALARERAKGRKVDPEAATLARAAREFARGRFEESLHHLRRTGMPGGAGVREPRPSGPATESSRTL
jgi:hypothetical protein